MQYVVFEVWTRARVVDDAESVEDAYAQGEPLPIPGLSLSNWHAVPVIPGSHWPEAPSPEVPYAHL